jgi:aspartate/methionine/tyrosine aminotransferase
MLLKPLKMAAYHAAVKADCKIDLSSSSAETCSINELLALSDKAASALWHGDYQLGYSSPMGLECLREEIACWHKVNLEQTMCFAGAVEAMFTVCASLLDQDDEVIVIQPGFEPLWAIAQSLGIKVNAISLDYHTEDKRWTLDLNKLEHALQHHQKTRLLLINFPHNPTGMTISRATLQQIIHLADKHDTWLLSDEVFRGLEYEAEQQLPSAASIYSRAISIGVMSKALGLGGIRVGWAACQDSSLLQKLAKNRFYFSVCNGYTDEVLATIALKSRTEILTRNLEIIQQNLAVLRVFMQQHHLFEWLQPDSGCVAFPIVKPEQEDLSKHWIEKLVRKHGFKFLPGNLFSINGFNNHFRIGFGSKDFSKNLEQLNQIL